MLSAMKNQAPYSVSVVLDREFGPRLHELLKEGPVWVVDSPVNRDSAQTFWSEFPDRNHLDGVTVFRTKEGCPLAQMLVDEMETIDLHHGVYSADPAYTVIRVVGCNLDTAIQESLSMFGFDTFNRTAEGFEARRPLPLPLGD